MTTSRTNSPARWSARRITCTQAVGIGQVGDYQEHVHADSQNYLWRVTAESAAGKHVIRLYSNTGVVDIELQQVGYVSCVAGDIGKAVWDDGVNVGTLIAYDNALRVWAIDTSSATILAGSAMTIPTGTGAGTTLVVTATGASGNSYGEMDLAVKHGASMRFISESSATYGWTYPTTGVISEFSSVLVGRYIYVVMVHIDVVYGQCVELLRFDMTSSATSCLRQQIYLPDSFGTDTQYTSVDIDSMFNRGRAFLWIGYVEKYSDGAGPPANMNYRHVWLMQPLPIVYSAIGSYIDCIVSEVWGDNVGDVGTYQAIRHCTKDSMLFSVTNGKIDVAAYLPSRTETTPLVNKIYENYTGWHCFDDEQQLSTVAGGGQPGGAHDILSATHTDSTASAVSRGSLITGQGAVPTWAELNAGAPGTVLTMGANEPGWAAPGAGADVKVAVDAAAVGDYLGATDAVGALQVDGATLGKTDGGNFITLAVKDEGITLAKMAHINTDLLLGRDSAGAGDVEPIQVGGGIEFTGGNAIQTSAFTGEVTKAAGGTAQTIANDAVTYAKMQNVSASPRIMGRTSVGAGDMEELIVGAGLSAAGGQLACTITQTVDKVFMYGQILTGSTNTDQYLFNGSVQYSAAIGNQMTRDGSVTGISAVGTVIDPLGAGTMAIKVYKNGALLDAACIVTITKADMHQYVQFAAGTYTFVAGDVLQIYLDVQTVSAIVSNLMATVELTIT